MKPKEEILVAMVPGGIGPIGNIWRITAKKTDFYLDPAAEVEAVHLSMHGANAQHPDGHRFHVKVDRKAAATAGERGFSVAYGIPRQGFVFSGEQIAEDAFLVARVRWTWDILGDRYRRVVGSGPLPIIGENQSGRIMQEQVKLNYAVDLDVVIGMGRPHWPGGKRSARDNSRLGPLRNDANLWLTATMMHRWQSATPTPPDLVVPRPRPVDQPARIMFGGPSSAGEAGPYWFVESITSQQVVQDSQRAWLERRGEPRRAQGAQE